MRVNYQHIGMYHRLIIAGIVGLLIAILTTIRIFLPTLGLLAQFLLFSPLARTAIIVKLLSPAISFVLAGGWVWVLLFLGERWLSIPKRRESTSHVAPSQIPTLQERRPHYRLERSGILQDRTASEGSWNVSEKEKAIAAPPLFQLDPTNPWQYTKLPVTPLPMTNPAWSPSADQEESTNGDVSDGEEHAQEKISVTQAEQIMQSRVVDIPSQLEEEKEKPMTVDTSREGFSLQKSGERSETQKPVTMTLLKQMRAWVRADDGTTLEIKLRGGENAIRLIQLAYIAWRQGASVDRDKMLTYVLSRGKRRDMDADQLGEVFDAAKRYLRQDLDRAVNELKKNGHEVSEDVDFFSNEPGFYWLHSSCRVVDLEKIEEYYRTIQIARKEGLLDEKLDGSIPDWVLQACQNLIGAYPGDFLQSLLEKFPEELGPWVKEPVTFYRDRYLDAILIMAQYESALGKNFLDKDLSDEQNEEKRRYHIGRAAQLYYDYALYALNSRWDKKLQFAYRHGKDGERVIRASRALRRCVVELGKIGNPDLVDQVYLAFKERMSTLSEGNWKPDKDTEADVAEAKRTTSAYRFSSQISPPQNRNKN
jgi:hypothetical protein